jgi:peroxiredoxin Q/BCP
MSSVAVGDKVPDFAFQMTDGKTHHFADFAGKSIVLYFYPKDDTPGCTLEAQGFRDHMQEFSAKNAVIIGISKDNEKSHKKFREKYCLPFELIMDTEGMLAEAFGVWKEKSMYGKKYMGIERSTFLIDTEGRLAKEWRKVSVTGHVQAVLESL